MNESGHLAKKPLSIIQEIEAQLEDYLRHQREEIEKTLDEKIQKERELARQQMSRIEEEVKKEWQSLEEYGSFWEQVDQERNRIMEQIKDYLQRLVHRQKEIENLARATSEDIQAINQLHERLEEIRSQSMEKAAFLKKRLEDKFGLVAEIPEKAEEPEPSLDLTAELQKLRKIKELLILESKSEGHSINLSEEAQLDNTGLDKKLSEEIRKGLNEKLGMNSSSEIEASKSNEEKAETFSRSDLAEYYRQEPANGSGEIGYYKKGKKVIFEAGELLEKMKAAVEEAKKIACKLSFISAAKEQFFLKQELISTQEGLRRYLQRILLLSEKKSFRFPALTQDILNPSVIEELADLLGIQNWGSSDDLSFFEQKINAVISAFKNRVSPPSIYFIAIKKELEV